MLLCTVLSFESISGFLRFNFIEYFYLAVCTKVKFFTVLLEIGGLNKVQVMPRQPTYA